MRSLALSAAVALALPLSARAAEASGFVRTTEGALELTGSGSFFGVYRPQRVEAPPPEGAEATPRPGPAAAAADPCRAQRSRYLRALLRMTGIDLDDPAAFLDGLAGAPSRSAQLFSAYGLLAGVDPIRPLAWDFELRSLARELARCGAGAR
jgi:hypothetical protein